LKRLILTDKSGRIIATGPHPAEYPEAASGRKSSFGISALKGQQVHEVELPDHIKTIEDIQALHKSHQIKVEAGKPTLVAKGKARR